MRDPKIMKIMKIMKFLIFEALRLSKHHFEVPVRWRNVQNNNIDYDFLRFLKIPKFIFDKS